MTLKAVEAYKTFKATPWMPLEKLPDYFCNEYSLMVTEDGTIEGYFRIDPFHIKVLVTRAHFQSDTHINVQFWLNGVSASRLIPLDNFLVQLGMLHEEFNRNFHRKREEYLSHMSWYENELVSDLSNLGSLGFLTDNEKTNRELLLQKRLNDIRQQAKDMVAKHQAATNARNEEDRTKKAYEQNVRELYTIAANSQFTPWVFYHIIVAPKELKVIVEDEREDEDKEFSLDFTISFYSLTKPDEHGNILSIRNSTIEKTQIFGEILSITERSVNSWKTAVTGVTQRIPSPFYDLTIHWNPSETFNPPVVSDAAKWFYSQTHYCFNV